MGEQWWRKVKTYFKGDAGSKGSMLILGIDPTAQQILLEAFGDNLDLVYDDGATPISKLVGDVPPGLVLADFVLFRDSELRNQIVGDERLAGVPLLLLADEDEMIPNEQLINLGVAGIINRPLDPEELRSQLGDILDTFASAGSGSGSGKSSKDKSKTINLDDFDMESLDEGLRNLNRFQEPPPSTPPKRQKEKPINNDKYASELEKMLAEIDETPSTGQAQESSMDEQLAEIAEQLAEISPTEQAEETPVAEQAEETPVAEQAEETPVAEQAEETPVAEQAEETPVAEQAEEITVAGQEEEITPPNEQKEAVEMKVDKSLEDVSEAKYIQEPAAVSQGVEAPSPMQSVAPVSASPVDGTVEQWFRTVAEEKIALLISRSDFSKTIESVARSVVPQIAEELVTKEIEKIKKKIIG